MAVCGCAEAAAAPSGAVCVQQPFLFFAPALEGGWLLLPATSRVECYLGTWEQRRILITFLCCFVCHTPTISSRQQKFLPLGWAKAEAGRRRTERELESARRSRFYGARAYHFCIASLQSAPFCELFLALPTNTTFEHPENRTAVKCWRKNFRTSAWQHRKYVFSTHLFNRWKLTIFNICIS